MATKIFRGDLPEVTKVVLLSVSGTLTANATYTVSLKDEAGNTVRSVVYTSDSGPTAAEISAGITAAIEAAAYTEFDDFIVTDNEDGTVTITQNENTANGLTLTFTLATSGSATVAVTTPTASSSPEDWSLTGNWSGGALPNVSGADDVYISNMRENISCGLAAVPLVTNVVIENARRIGGLEYRNGYREYREKYLAMKFAQMIINSPESDMIRINGLTMNALAQLIVNDATTNKIDNVLEPIQFICAGSAGCAVTLNKGSMGIAIYPGETAKIPTIRQNYTTSAGDTWLRCGSGVDLDNVYRTGGDFEFASALALLDQRDQAGVATFRGGGVDLDEVAIYAGSLVMIPTADDTELTSIVLGPRAKLDLSKCSFSVRCPATVIMYEEAELIDPYNRLATATPTDMSPDPKISVTPMGCTSAKLKITRGIGSVIEKI